MLNRTTLPPTALTTTGAARSEERMSALLEGSLARRLARLLQLPTTSRGYAGFIGCLLILAFTMVLHITLSAEILRMEVRLKTLKQEYSEIEQTNSNIVWQIAGYSALDDISAKAALKGYVGDIPVHYVMAPRPADTPGLMTPDPAAGAPGAAGIEGRLVVMGSDQAPGEPQLEAQTAAEESLAPVANPAAEAGLEPAADRWKRAQAMYDNFVSWLRTLVPGQFQPAP